MQTIMHTHVSLDVERVNFPLRPIYVGQHSSLKIHLTGKIPDGAAAAITVKPIGGGDAWSLPSADTQGGLEIFIPGWAFQDPGQTPYEITLTADGKGYWMGRGTLTVIDALAEMGGGPVKPPSLDGQWWFVQQTQLWHKLTLVIDPDTGLATIKIGETGYAEIPND